MLSASSATLAERLRPITLNDVAGQQHLVGEKGVLRSGTIPSMIFFASGCRENNIG